MSDNNKDDSKVPSISGGISLTPSISSLFKPTFELVGLEIRDRVKETIDNWKEKRQKKNLEAHINAVNKQLEGESLSNDSEPSINQLNMFEEWVEGVQDVDPADEDLSEIWRNLLIRSARGEPVLEEVRRVVKSLSPSEAQYLCMLEDIERRAKSRGLGEKPIETLQVTSKNQYIANQLRAKGLVEKNFIKVMLFAFAMTALGLGTLAALVYTKVWGVVPSLLLGAAFIWICILLFYMRLDKIVNWQVSWLGKQLLRTVNEQKARNGERPSFR